MTHAICPACRSAIALDAALCARCGMAVRPTCANCGEALGPTDEVCPRCREAIESEPLPVVPVAAPARVQRTAAPPIPAPAIPVVVEGSAPKKRRRRGTLAQLLIIGVVAGVLVAGGLLGLEVFVPNSTAPVDLVHRSFPDLGFSLSRPANWTETVRPVGGNPAVAFSPGASRGFRVVVLRTDLARVRAEVRRERQHPPPNKDPIQAGSAVVDGHSALRYVLVQDGQYRQLWWVERPGGVFRIEFWSPEYNQRDAGELAQHIVDTFTLG